MNVYAGIVLYNPEIQELRVNIEAVIDQVEKIILVDNGSTNQKIYSEIAKKGKVVLIRNKKNKGIAYALNQIVRWGQQHGYEWGLLLDQDSQCPKNMICFYEQYCHDSQVAVICPDIVDRNMKHHRTMETKVTEKIIYSNQVITSGALVNIPYCIQLGGFDQRLFIDFVDTDFFERVLRNKLSIVRVHAVKLVHSVGVLKEYSVLGRKIICSNHNAFRRYYMVRNRLYFQWKYFGRTACVREYVRLMLGTCKIVLLEDKKYDKVKAWIRGCKDWKKLVQKGGKKDGMKILFVSHDDGKYGAAKSLMVLISLLRKEYKIIPVVITRKQNEVNAWCREENIENYALPYVGCITYAFENKGKRELYRKKQNLKNYICNILSLQLLKKKVKFQEFDAVYTNVSTINFGAVISQKYHLPHIWHIREFGYEDIGSCPVSNHYYEWMNQSFQILAISNAIRDSWISKGVKKEKIATVYNGILPEIFCIHDFSKKDTRIKIMFCGSSAPHKGADQVLAAMEKLLNMGIQNISLDLYGDYSSEYIERSQELIRFKGYSNQLNEIMQEYDIGIVASKAEGFGRITVEYMMSGLAVIASDCGANPELITDGRDGLLYSYNNASDLADKILYLVKNQELRNQIAQRGLEKARKNFTAEENARHVYEYLRKLKE